MLENAKNTQQQQPHPPPAHPVSIMHHRHQKPKKAKLTSMSTFVIKTSSNEKARLDLEVAKFFYACAIPLNAASKQPFKNMIEALRPGYQPPSRQALSGELLQTCYDEVVNADIEHMLADGTNTRPITLMQDGWSAVTNDAIIANSILVDGKSYLLSTVNPGRGFKKNC